MPAPDLDVKNAGGTKPFARFDVLELDPLLDVPAYGNGVDDEVARMTSCGGMLATK